MKTASFYQAVPNLEEVTNDWVVPGGETWEVTRFVGSAAYLDDVTVSLVWDSGGTPSILCATHGDADVRPAATIVGDGTKVLSLTLTNDTNVTRVIGGMYVARKL